MNRSCSGKSDRHALLRQGCGNEGSGANPALEVPLGKQLGIGAQDRKPRDAELGGKLPAGRDALAGTQFAAQDRSAKSVVDLLVQRIVRFAVDNQCGQNSGRGAVHTAIIVASMPPALVDMAADHLVNDYGLDCGPTIERYFTSMEGQQGQAKTR